MRPLDPAPELPAGEWLHLSAPVDLRHDLAGRVVLLLFWAASCAHSRQALSTVDWLDRRFAGRPLAVIGVASPRVPLDADAVVVADACAERAVRVPVFLDPERAVFGGYECVAWPTLVLVDGTGRVRYHGAGEVDATALAQAVKTLLAEVEYGGYGYSLPDLPRVAPPEPVTRCAGLAVDAARSWLWVADPAHHRVLALDLEDATLRAEVGCGRPGACDGASGEAAFFAPCAVAVAGARIVVADGGNHVLRAIDAVSLAVSTIAGSGTRDTSGIRRALPAPSAVVGDASECFVASALGHQILHGSLEGGDLEVAAGSGARGDSDGEAAKATLAQPAALARAGDRLAFCDAGSHSLRVVDLATRRVTTLVAGAGFAGGSGDGAAATARFRQPAGLAWDGESLLVADRGNDRVCRVDLAAGTVATILDARHAVTAPVALALHGRRLFVAAADGRRLLVCDLDRGDREEWALPGVPVAKAAPLELRLRAYSDCSIKFPLVLTPGARLHQEVAVRVRLANASGTALAVDLTYDAVVEGEYAVARGVTTGEPGRGTVAFSIDYVTRPGGGSDVVHPQSARGSFGLTCEQDAPTLAVCRPAAEPGG